MDPLLGIFQRFPSKTMIISFHIISASASKDLEDTTDPYRSSTPKQTTSSLEVEWPNLGSPRKNMVSTWGEIAKFHS